MNFSYSYERPRQETSTAQCPLNLSGYYGIASDASTTWEARDFLAAHTDAFTYSNVSLRLPKEASFVYGDYDDLLTSMSYCLTADSTAWPIPSLHDLAYGPALASSTPDDFNSSTSSLATDVSCKMNLPREESNSYFAQYPHDLDSTSQQSLPRFPLPDAPIRTAHSNQKERRRIQNRNSQRAHRERKERQISQLERELESIREKYSNLLECFGKLRVAIEEHGPVVDTVRVFDSLDDRSDCEDYLKIE